MQRRTALKHLLIAAGGTLLLPSCLHSDKKASIPLDHLKINATQEDLLAEIAETLIPKTDTAGAKELGVHQFVLTMVDDCHEKETQQNFLKGLDQLDDLSEKHYNAGFIKASLQQREELLSRIEKKEFKGDVLSFYLLMKELTIEGYVKSKYVMSNLLPYELVPARFHGCVPVNNKIRLYQNG